MCEINKFNWIKFWYYSHYYYKDLMGAPTMPLHINRHSRKITPFAHVGSGVDIILQLLTEYRWVSTKTLRRATRHVDNGVNTIIEHIRKKGNVRYEIISRKVRDKLEYQLVLTEKQEVALPVEIDDCGKVEIVSHRATLGGSTSNDPQN